MRTINNHEPESPWRKWRLDNRYMLRELSEIMGVSSVAVSAFERGKINSDRMRELYTNAIAQLGGKLNG